LNAKQASPRWKKTRTAAIVFLSLASTKLNRMQITDYADRYLVERLSTVPGVAQVQVNGGQSFSMRGFRVISPEKINTLTDVQILELHKKGWLPLFYFHLQSTQHWPALSQMIPQAAAA
jgi:hypothetical protein